MSTTARHVLLALSVATLLVPAVADGVESRTPAPGAQAQVTPPKLVTPTPLPVRRDDLPLNLPPCSVTGALKWDAQLLKDSTTPPNPNTPWKNAYSGSMTITATKALTGFVALKLVASVAGGGEVGDCGGWPAQQVDLAKGQSRTYPVRCLWGGSDTSGTPLSGAVKIGYGGTVLAFCDGTVTFGK